MIVIVINAIVISIIINIIYRSPLPPPLPVSIGVKFRPGYTRLNVSSSSESRKKGADQLGQYNCSLNCSCLTAARGHHLVQ